MVGRGRAPVDNSRPHRMVERGTYAEPRSDDLHEIGTARCKGQGRGDPKTPLGIRPRWEVPASNLPRGERRRDGQGPLLLLPSLRGFLLPLLAGLLRHTTPKSFWVIQLWVDTLRRVRAAPDRESSRSSPRGGQSLKPSERSPRDDRQVRVLRRFARRRLGGVPEVREAEVWGPTAR